MDLMGRTYFGGVVIIGHQLLLYNIGLLRESIIIITLILVLMDRIVDITPKLFGEILEELVVLRLFVIMVVVFLLLVIMTHPVTILDQDPIK